MVYFLCSLTIHAQFPQLLLLSIYNISPPQVTTRYPPIPSHNFSTHTPKSHPPPPLCPFPPSGHIAPHLFSSVYDVLWEGESARAGPADDGMMTRRCVRHLHRAELQERLPQDNTTQQQLPANNNNTTN